MFETVMYVPKMPPLSALESTKIMLMRSELKKISLLTMNFLWEMISTFISKPNLYFFLFL